MEIILNEMTLWLFGTAVIFTIVGRYLGYKASVEDVVSSTIDSLIKDGYLKVEGEGEDMEIIKHTDWYKERD